VGALLLVDTTLAAALDGMTQQSGDASGDHSDGANPMTAAFLQRSHDSRGKNRILYGRYATGGLVLVLRYSYP